MTPSDRIISSLDDVLAPDAESQLAAAMQHHLLDGIAIGILRDGQSYLRLAGAGVEAESRFEIGSVTKVYTAELLAILAERGVVRLEDAVAKYLPTRIRRELDPRSITLLDLATHRSGLPRLPPNLRPAHASDPYARYGTSELDEYLKKAPLQRPLQQQFLYSNLGYAILGYALSQAAGASYCEMLSREILTPLNLTQTTLAMAGQVNPKVLSGHTQTGRPAQHWTFDACAPAGALCSTVKDQLKWLLSLLADPDRATLQPHASAGTGQVGLGWMIRPDGESCWHNGATGGFSSYVALHRKQHYGVVVLANRHAPSLVLRLGTNLERSLKGLPMLPLEGDYGKARAHLLEPVRALVGPLVALPAWIRYPLAGVGAYSLAKLGELLTHH
jgi:serine-type D-Ala-D-Ala carboxypeptidase/endopeptidase